MRSQNLSFLGVAEEDEEVYRLLLRRGEMTLSQLGNQLGRTLEETSRRLIASGLVRQTADGALHPVSPARAVDHLIDDSVADLRTRLEQEVVVRGIVDSLIAERELLLDARRTAQADAAIQRLEGMEAVRAVIDELAFFTWTESLTTNPAGVLSEDTIAHARPIDERILRRGVHMRTLLGAHALDDDPTMAYARELVAKGAEIRISRAPLERLIICDRSAALTPIDPAHTARGAILTREAGLVAALVSLFERMWDLAEELPEQDVVGSSEALTELERQVLQLMCTAEKDDNGARELGVAVRTYRKYVAVLMRRLGATNRFQAALRARERGWI
ncbi:LuxR C-terminal-related transcriptional regulator [Streptomyces sp. NPDC045431]|uniref:helix-turn-helix transcriptional regulator n=1 Tax=Streptomyces sp. NPDC045431 TaxID=3155613 RepID=UPI0033E69DB3